jgi:leader peptidase (prepilin peptidase)/N-methyltransferase
LGAFLAALTLAIAASDFHRYMIPNELTAAAAALARLRTGTGGPEAGWEAMSWTAAGALAVALPRWR